VNPDITLLFQATGLVAAIAEPWAFDMKTPEFVLDHPCGVTITRHLTQLGVADVEGTTKRDMGTGYFWYSLPESVIHGFRVAISLCFRGPALDSVQFALVDPVLYGASWNDWSEEKARLCAKDTGEWLRSPGYPSGRFAWGEVWAEYDPRGGSGGGGVRYFVEPTG
jgi:hypothetical protein